MGEVHACPPSTTSCRITPLAPPATTTSFGATPLTAVGAIVFAAERGWAALIHHRMDSGKRKPSRSPAAEDGKRKPRRSGDELAVRFGAPQQMDCQSRARRVRRVFSNKAHSSTPQCSGGERVHLKSALLQ